MSYDAKVFNVMIASPGDVASERNIIREVIYEWNVIHSAAKKVVLLPVGWDTHSSPEMGRKPQELINDQVLDKCDLLVGVFWTRVGTETDEYASGTVEEIERHITSGKPTMVYFSNKPVHPDSVDQDQYAKLKEFKESCKEKGLFETFSELSEFKDKFFRQLQIKINDDRSFCVPNIIQNHSEISESISPEIPKLSNEAIILLKEACKDNHGIIMNSRTLKSTVIQTNGRNMITDESRRNEALWEGALSELVDHDLVIERGYKGEIFEVTSKGYELADMLVV
ncbi:MAG: DUF4062 domain-containing protein [Armatimonadota bacterium]